MPPPSSPPPSAPPPDTADQRIADASPDGWVERAPAAWRPYLRLARYDRPIGFWLVAIPCWVGLAAGRLQGGWTREDALIAALYGLGAVAMRGAGCTINDILDRKLDAQVARTANRPLASGALSVCQALWFLAAQCGVGALVLLALPPLAQLVAVASVPLVALYPLMKRVTWWPQAWLGFTINWGVLVGYAAAAGRLDWGVAVIYAGLAFWTLGYDTIYAHQDREDDALVGVRSTARLFGDRSRLAISLFYVASVACVAWGVARASAGAPAIGVTAVLGFGAALVVQMRQPRLDDADWCLAAFRANRAAGLWLVAGVAAVTLAAS